MVVILCGLQRAMRCDLHVHTVASGMCHLPLLNRVCRECYNQPEAVYETLRRRGMSLVTVTDHDSIDAVEVLRGRPDFFLSEEVTCTTPSGTHLHMGVYNITSRQHIELQRLRDDMTSLLAYLREQDLFFSINHVFSSLTGARDAMDFALFQTEFPGVETRNGQLPMANNEAAALLASAWGKAPVAGSDAHTLASLARTYTEVPGARNAAEFMAGLRAGKGRPAGEHGSYLKLTRAILEIGKALTQEHPWALSLFPLFFAVPAVMAANCLSEYAFLRKWSPCAHAPKLPFSCAQEPVC